MGAALGVLLACANVYIGLKTGLHLGVALTACVLSYAGWGFFRRVGLARTPMTILENNCMQSTASAAGSSTGNTVISAIPALLLLSVSPGEPGGRGLPWFVMALWVFFLAVLGTSLAIPMKRDLINRERLKFPSGTAAAVLLRSLYSEGGGALAKARGLLQAALAAGFVPLLRDLRLVQSGALVPGSFKIFDWLPGVSGAGKTYALSDWNIKLDYSPALLATGALVGLRVTASMVAGGLVLALFVGPRAMETTWTNPSGVVLAAVRGPGSVRDVGVWLGAFILVSSSLLWFVLEWRTIGRAFRGFGGAAARQAEHAAPAEVPTSWFALGAGFATAGIVALAARFFSIPVHLGLLAVLLTSFLALIACRAAGESDFTPAGPLGKIMQLGYGVLMRQNVSANLMTAAVTAGASAASADLLTDLKSGYLLGANPRRQYVAQLIGVVPGTVATVLCYAILFPDATALSGAPGRDPTFAVPAAHSWIAVAKVLELGVDHLHPMARHCIFYGLTIGVLLTLLERTLPRHKKYLPSATGLGLGMMTPFPMLLAMLLGAVAAAVVERKKGHAAEMVVPVASGMIAGESVAGVIVAALNQLVLK
jgi:uncharacterized oligopeptide transporter (OPT) family protein